MKNTEKNRQRNIVNKKFWARSSEWKLFNFWVRRTGDNGGFEQAKKDILNLEFEIWKFQLTSPWCNDRQALNKGSM